MKNKLQSCPFCGRVKYLEVLRDVHDLESGAYQVVCSGCQVAGPLVDDCYPPYSNKEEAIKAWNTRKVRKEN
jgi:Lar family restriction alleviation protein